MLLDKTSEAIAHFIGLFGTIVEDARERLMYDEFLASRLLADDGTLPDINASFTVSHKLEDFVPGVNWQPSTIEIVKGNVSFLPFQKIEVDIAAPDAGVSQQAAYKAGASATVFGQQLILPDIPTLGSVANYINQMIGLSDDDYFSVGGNGLKFSPPPVGNEAVLKLAAEASEMLFNPGSDVPGSPEALKEFASALRDYVERMDPDAAPDNVFIHNDTVITGTYVNGQLVEEAPNLDDFFSLDARLEALPSIGDPLPKNAKLTDDGIVVVDQSVTIEMGQNTLINSAVLTNLWTGSPVMAVAGDHTELNVITQVNAYADQDSVSAMLEAWHQESSTETFNIANFQRVDPLEEGTSGQASASFFPEHWVVKTIEGDLMIVNWMQQFTFQSDNDIGIASSSGVTTKIYAGNNTAVNTISIYELGTAYDLIVVGGSVYDINVIQQMNVLYDNDLVGTVEGFHTSGQGVHDTSGNLLWNEAHIYNIGGADRFQTMPDEYRDAAQKMIDGDFSPNALLNDPMFADAPALRVLYIDGNLFDIQSIRQVNILGDADQLALAMNESGFFDTSDWTITTGNNALINLAAITDMDSLGITYVGGQQYSQELLVQADIISTSPEFGWQDPDALVNEAVAFLSDDLDGSDSDPYSGNSELNPHVHYDDGVQSMLA